MGCGNGVGGVCVGGGGVSGWLHHSMLSPTLAVHTITYAARHCPHCVMLGGVGKDGGVSSRVRHQRGIVQKKVVI